MFGEADFFREATFFFGWRGCHDRAPALTSPPHDFFVRFMLQRKTNVFKSKAVCASLNERAVRIKLIFIGQFQFLLYFCKWKWSVVFAPLCCSLKLWLTKAFRFKSFKRKPPIFSPKDDEATGNVFAVLVFFHPRASGRGNIGFSVGVGCSILC